MLFGSSYSPGVRFSCLALFTFSLVGPDGARAATFDFLSGALQIDSNSISTTADGVTATAMAYHVEFDSGLSTIFGPFTTGPGARAGLQVFGPCARGGCGLGLTTHQDLGQTDTDIPSGGLRPGFDNLPARLSLPSIQFALFSFDAPIDVSQVIVDDVSNFGRTIWAAGGDSAPDLTADLLGAFAGYNVTVSPDDRSDGVFVHELTPFESIRFLAVGTPPLSSVGDVGPFLSSGGSQFYINGIGFAPASVPGLPSPTPSAIPEPGAFWLLLTGGVIPVLVRLRRASRALKHL